MKAVLAFLLALLSSSSYAAAVPLTPGPGVAGTASGFTTAANFTGQFSAASFNNTFSTNVGGKMVTMPATMRLAANAPQFAANALRLSPATVLGTLAASWLLGKGLAYVEGQWFKEQETSTPIQGAFRHGHDLNAGPFPDPQTACNDFRSRFTVSSSVSYKWNQAPYENGCYLLANQTEIASSRLSNTGQIICPVGTTQNGGLCVGVARTPATDADWASIPQNSPLPDPVAGELAAKGVPLPLEVPHIAPQDIPLSDPYVDPVTGKRYRDQARITPSSDRKTADVQTYKQEVDEAGNPKKKEDGQTDKPPEEQTDFCKKNPGAIACMPEGQTDDQELQTKNIGSGISPISIGGQGQCMADKTLSMATMGKSITFTYKPICDLASMVRPLILALAWLLAGWIMVGAVKDN